MNLQLISPIPYDGGRCTASVPSAESSHRPTAAQLTEAVLSASGGSLHAVTVTGPTGDPVFAWFGMLDRLDPPTAVIQACAIGPAPTPPPDAGDAPAPATTSWGVGELICAAMDEGAQRIVLLGQGCRLDDQGAGMVRALGERMPHRNGRVLETDLACLAVRLRGRLRAHHQLLRSCLAPAHAVA